MSGMHPPPGPERRARQRRAVRAIGRYAGAVLATMGALLVVDAAVTLAWQEPLSALLASRHQASLERQLAVDEARLGREERALPPIADARRRMARLAKLVRRRTGVGSALGRIRLPTLGRRYVMVHGTDPATLRKGPGHYPTTSLPGQAGTVAIAGHRTTYLAPFRTIDRLRPGDPVAIDMPYGRFTYSVERTRIVLPTATWVIRPVAGPERLVLTACHPLYSASRRIVVFARLTAVSPRPAPSSDEESRDSSQRMSATTPMSASANTVSQ
jgi:sortase A